MRSTRCSKELNDTFIPGFGDLVLVPKEHPGKGSLPQGSVIFPSENYTILGCKNGANIILTDVHSGWTEDEFRPLHNQWFSTGIRVWALWVHTSALTCPYSSLQRMLVYRGWEWQVLQQAFFILWVPDPWKPKLKLLLFCRFCANSEEVLWWWPYLLTPQRPLKIIFSLMLMALLINVPSYLL